MLPPVPATDTALDWDALDAEFEWVRALRGVPQVPVHHAEGDVWIHTKMLALLAEADARGRVCADQRKLLDSVELFRELCREVGCFERPFPFASAHSRFEYFRTRGRDPDYAAQESSRFEVTLLSGLPGSGKGRWLGAQGASLDVVSLDEIRRRLGVDPRDDQGRVVDAARQRARELLRLERPFAWNATNLSRRIRAPLIGLFADYGARVSIAYCEAPCTELYARNAAREHSVAERAMEAMLQRWEVPDLTEAHGVKWV